jgi:hypothetical protein
VGHWELRVDLAGAEDVCGKVVFEVMGAVLLQRTSLPVPDAPASCCIVVAGKGRFKQHYFDSRGVARLYPMTFDGHTWTLERTAPDFTPLDIYQRSHGAFSDDLSTIAAEWQSSMDGREWSLDFGLTYRRALDESASRQ